MASYDVEVLNTLVSDLATAGDEYSKNYAEMTSVIDNIEQGTMTGPCAETLKRLYDDKKETFQAVQKFVDDNRDELHQEAEEGKRVLDETREGMN